MMLFLAITCSLPHTLSFRTLESRRKRRWAIAGSSLCCSSAAARDRQGQSKRLVQTTMKGGLSSHNAFSQSWHSEGPICLWVLRVHRAQKLARPCRQVLRARLPGTPLGSTTRPPAALDLLRLLLLPFLLCCITSPFGRPSSSSSSSCASVQSSRILGPSSVRPTRPSLPCATSALTHADRLTSPFDPFAEIAQSISKLSKKCILHFSDERAHLICCDETEGGVQVWSCVRPHLRHCRSFSPLAPWTEP